MHSRCTINNRNKTLDAINTFSEQLEERISLSKLKTTTKKSLFFCSLTRTIFTSPFFQSQRKMKALSLVFYPAISFLPQFIQSISSSLCIMYFMWTLNDVLSFQWFWGFCLLFQRNLRKLLRSFSFLSLTYNNAFNEEAVAVNKNFISLSRSGKRSIPFSKRDSSFFWFIRFVMMVKIDSMSMSNWFNLIFLWN